MTIKFSLEKLYHFSCGECNKWFSIGDWTPNADMTCPHCGVKQSVEPIEEKQEATVAGVPVTPMLNAMFGGGLISPNWWNIKN